MIYVVAGPGRTGSTWLAQLIAENTSSRIHNLPTGDPEIDTKTVDEITERGKPEVIHTHEQNLATTLEIDPRAISLVISRRRNTYAMILSHFVAGHTGEYGEYTGKEIEPVAMDLTRFKRAYKYRDSWYEKVNLTLPYANISTVYYEDIVSAVSRSQRILKPLLGNVIDSGDWQPIGKSPYNFRDVISNWEEVYTWYRSQLPG